MLLGTYHTQQEFSERLTIFRNRGIDGLLMISGGDLDETSLALLPESLPKICIGNPKKIPGISNVRVAPYAIGECGARELLKNNHRNIGYLHIGDFERLNGFKNTFKEFKSEFNDSLLIKCKNNFDDGCEKMTLLLKSHPEIDAVFTDSDILAGAAIKSANLPAQITA